MNTSYRVSKLTKSDKSLFVTLMSEAFARDPLFLHLFGDSEFDSKARSSVTAFISFLFDKSFLLHEEVWGYFENENLLGAYIVEKPHASMLQKMRGLLLIVKLIPLLFHLSGKTLNLLNSYMRVTRSAAPPFMHHYLIMIGVQQEEQGKGIGKALLHHLLNTVNTDKKSQGVALDTENKENVNLYGRFGFTLSRETQIDNVTVYCMFCQKNS
ncbi:GNAT family N-acetyltransferase [Paenibacillus dendritiformis]|uniref:GNAT family N-acetyltransferase n=1 Tax=Paenibacillus dendritiformis TaxID=130049 RepID=UPI00248B35EE|nr:GNAT family N-acetyltransferase [Paenibacillus dendritiformis]WGU92480.1 GNAT family N-acetyltransferase [Paenibacillus dendritiformis]